MANPESSLRQQVVKLLRHRHAVPVENSVCPGTPDVNFAFNGWIELKQIAQWPKRVSTPVKIPKFTEDQRLWHRQRTKAGGDVYLLLKVGKGRQADYLLFISDEWFTKKAGKLSRSELVSCNCFLHRSNSLKKLLEVAECSYFL